VVRASAWVLPRLLQVLVLLPGGLAPLLSAPIQLGHHQGVLLPAEMGARLLWSAGVREMESDGPIAFVAYARRPRTTTNPSGIFASHERFLQKR